MSGPKGVTFPVTVVIGLVVAVVLIMIFFKVSSQYSAYQYEQQAEVTARNLQTAMNQVCVTGESQYVDINLPQEISSGGISTYSYLISKAKGEDAAITDAMRYAAAIDSFGDPWYIIYYENFPQGEDSGWMGWSEIASGRIASNYFFAADTAMCVATASVPFMSDLVRLGKTASYQTAETTYQIASDAIRKSRGLEESVEITTKAANYAGDSKTQTLAERLWMGEVGENIIKTRGYRQSLEPIYNAFVRSGLSGNDITRHMSAFSRSSGMIDETAESLSFLRGKVSVSDDLVDSVSSLSKSSTLNEEDFVATLSGLSDLAGRNNLLKSSGDILASKLDDLPKGGLTDLEKEYLDRLVGRVKTRNLQAEDVDCVRKIAAKGGDDWDEFEEILGNTWIVQKNTDDLSSIGRSSNLLSRGDVPIGYSYTFLESSQNKVTKLRASGLSYLKTLGSDYLRIVGGASAVREIGSTLVYSEGRWVVASEGGAFLFNNVVLTPLEQAKFKFNPCSDHALCMKSSVESAIHVYPLDDCEAVGIDYVELEKMPEGVELNDMLIAGANTVVDLAVGGTSTSKFYTASPCQGTLKVEKTSCQCDAVKVPYVDESSIDEFYLNCTLAENLAGAGDSVDLDCTLYRKMTYLGDDGLTEIVAEFETSADVELVNDLRYDLTLDLKEKGVGGERWTEYFGSYYEALDAEFDEPEANTEQDNIVDLEYETSLIEGEAGDLISFGSKFFPAVPFEYTVCDTSSNLWLKCSEWVEYNPNMVIVREGLDGEEEVPAGEWYCQEWVLSDGESESVLFTADSQEAYDDSETLRVSAGAALEESMGLDAGTCASEVAKSPPSDGLNECIEACGSSEEVWCSADTSKEGYVHKSAGDPQCIRQLGRDDAKCYCPETSEPLDLGVTNEDKKLEYCKSVEPGVLSYIEQNGRVVFPKVSIYGTEIGVDLVNGPSGIVGQLYDYNLPSLGSSDCLKVTYVVGDGDDATRGFCYTSPTSWTDALQAGVLVGASALDLGLELAIDAATAGGGAITGVGSGVSCMAGNLVLHAGEDYISQEKQASYWPNNAYFEDYFS